ncbi:MAG: hypothetical protein ABS46_10745 [Cytophagaceae bacterium SCN 52-12]|nr:MAG: hypothetical protein ABS46_10745 [Cytophagaceae bacterium SCN 52-12]
MHAESRKAFNASFSPDTYQSFLSAIERDFPGQLDFRVAESPVFVDSAFRDKLLDACSSIMDAVAAPDFLARTDRAIPPDQRVPGENRHTSFFAVDFAICRGASGELEPRLIELQGFPSVFGYQLYLSRLYQKRYPFLESMNFTFSGAADEEDAFISHFGHVLLGNEDPENVILLEIFPEKQKTRIDFEITRQYWGVTPVCLTKIIREGRKIFYEKEGRRIQVRRIYNRLIFDDLGNFPGLKTGFSLTDDADVTWVGHPNWFFRISKFMLPLLSGPYFPETRFLSDYGGNFPPDPENYVLKPLFSFAGSGVELHVTADKLAAIADPENYILQRKVTYEPVILTNDGSKVKSEIRMLYTWPDDAEKPVLLTALSRLSRGEMIGVRFNKDFTWVGSSAVFFER